MADISGDGVRIHNLLIGRNNVGQHSSESAGVLHPYSINHLDVGRNWTYLGIIGTNFQTTKSLGSGIILAGDATGLYKSTDYGNTWLRFDNSILNINAIENLGNGIILVGTTNGHIWRCVEHGLSGLSFIDTGAISAFSITRIKYLGFGIVIFADAGGFIQRNTNFGIGGGPAWTAIGLASTPLSLEYLENGIALAGGNTGHIYRSTTSGSAPWTDLGDITAVASPIRTLSYLSNGVIIAGANNQHIYRSTDFGVHWSDIGLIADSPIHTSRYLGNGIVIIGTFGGRVYRSNNYGAIGSWSDLGAVTPNAINSETLSYLGDGVVILGDNLGGIVRSEVAYKLDESVNDRSYSQLVGVLSPSSINYRDVGINWQDLGVISGALFPINAFADIGNGIAIAGDSNNHIWRTEDYGLNWTDLGAITANPVLSAKYIGNGIVVISALNHIWRSTDFGVNWTDLGVIGNVAINTISYLGNGIVIAGDASGIGNDTFRSTDFGATWGPVGNVSAHSIISSTYLENGIALMGDGGGHIIRSTNYGIGWTDLGAISVYVSRLSYLGNGIVLFSSTNGHIFRSIDFGINWTDLGLFTGFAINDLIYLGNGIVIFGTLDGHIFRSINYGLTWTNLGPITIHAINEFSYLGNGIALFGASGGHIYRSDVSYKIDESQSIIDPSFISTTISITIGRSHNVVIVDATGGNRIITIPLAATIQRGHEYIIKKIDATAFTVTLNPSGGELIDGMAAIVLNIQYQSVTIRGNGVNAYYIV